MADAKIVVLVGKDRKGDIDKIADELKTAGLKIDRTMSITGIISGTASTETLEDLRQIEGVAELREEKIFTLPPLDEKIPQ